MARSPLCCSLLQARFLELAGPRGGPGKILAWPTIKESPPEARAARQRRAARASGAPIEILIGRVQLVRQLVVQLVMCWVSQTPTRITISEKEEVKEEKKKRLIFWF